MFLFVFLVAIADSLRRIGSNRSGAVRKVVLVFMVIFIWTYTFMISRQGMLIFVFISIVAELEVLFMRSINNFHGMGSRIAIVPDVIGAGAFLGATTVHMVLSVSACVDGERSLV